MIEKFCEISCLDEWIEFGAVLLDLKMTDKPIGSWRDIVRVHTTFEQSDETILENYLYENGVKRRQVNKQPNRTLISRGFHIECTTECVFLWEDH